MIPFVIHVVYPCLPLFNRLGPQSKHGATVARKNCPVGRNLVQIHTPRERGIQNLELCSFSGTRLESRSSSAVALIF